MDAGPGRRLRSWYPVYRGALVLLLLNGLTGVLLARRLGPRDALLADAAIIAALAMAAVVTALRFPRKWTPYVVVGAALALSRNILVLSRGELFGVRDAALHVFRLPQAILDTGHVPPGTSYSTFPLIHLILAGVSLLTGIQLWVAQALTATVFALCTAAVAGLVTRTMTAAPAAPLVAWTLFLGDPSVIPAGELFQPLSFTVLLFAMLILLANRMRSHHLHRTLFIVMAILLAMTHPYSAAIVMTCLAVAAAAELFTNRRYDLAIIVGVGVAFAFVYAAYVASRLDFFVGLFAKPQGQGLATLDYTKVQTTLALKATGATALGIFYGAAAIGWSGLLFRLRQLALTLAHELAAALAMLAAMAYSFPVLIGGRILMFAAVLGAPFGAHALTGWRSGRAVAPLVVPLLIMCSLTGVFAVYQFTPWADAVAVDQPLRNEPVHDSIETFLVLDTHFVPFGFVPLYTSHFVQYEGRTLDGRALGNGLNAQPSRNVVIVWRDDSQRYGYGGATGSRTPSGAPDTFTPYPTADQLALLKQSDRLGQFGPYLVARM